MAEGEAREEGGGIVSEYWYGKRNEGLRDRGIKHLVRKLTCKKSCDRHAQAKKGGDNERSR